MDRPNEETPDSGHLPCRDRVPSGPCLARRQDIENERYLFERGPKWQMERLTGVKEDYSSAS